MKLIFTTLLACLFSVAASANEWVELPAEQAADVAQAVVDASSPELVSNCISSTNNDGNLGSYGDSLNVSKFAIGAKVFQNTMSQQPILKLVNVKIEERINDGFLKIQQTALVTTDAEFMNVTSILYSLRRELHKRRPVNKGTILEPDYQPGSAVVEFFYKDTTCDLP